MEFFYDVKFIMWLLTMVGVALIKFNDLAHLAKSFKELKEDIKNIVGKMDKIIEKIEQNEVRIAEIDVRCEEREKHFAHTLDIICKAQKTTRRKKASKK